MKVYNKYIILSIFFLILSSNSFAKTRGIKVSVETPTGKTIELYRNSYALVVGNGNYTNGWDPLPGAINDVKEISDALKRNGFKVELRTNLTKDEFNKEFMNFVYKHGLDFNNRLLFYYAGHGHTRPMATGEELGYIVMVNAPKPEKDIVGFVTNSVDMQSLVTQAKNIIAKHVLFIFDSCFSGTVLNLRSEPTPNFISDNVKLPVRQFITAGRANESVPDYSVFKQCFLDVLEGRDAEPIKDGYLTGEELGLYLKNKVPSYNKNQHPQYGKIKDPKLDKGDFVFLLGSSGAIVEEPAPTSLKAYLSVESNVSSAKVLIDGRYVGTTNLSNIEVSSKEHQIKVEKDGYEPYTRKISFEKGRIRDLHVILDPKAPLKSRLYLQTQPENARIRILNIGPAFHQGIELDAGRYHVEVSANGYETQKMWVSLTAGQDKTLDIQLKHKVSSDVNAKEIARDGRFKAYDNGTVKDTKTGLMWASKDNGENINWKDAKRYCENYRGGGYTDWRMPTQNELAELYEPNTKNTKPSTRGCGGGYHINKLFHITCCCPWASETSGSGAAFFDFSRGGRSWFSQSFSNHYRALPVRSGK